MAAKRIEISFCGDLTPDVRAPDGSRRSLPMVAELLKTPPCPNGTARPTPARTALDVPRNAQHRLACPNISG
jgi:hypothetical protein